MGTHRGVETNKTVSPNSKGKFKRCNIVSPTLETTMMYHEKFLKEEASHRFHKLLPILVAQSWADEEHSNKEDKGIVDSLVPVVGINAVTVRRIAASNSRGQVYQPMPGTDGDNESDFNADTCRLGQNYVVLQFTRWMAEAFAFNENLPSNTVPIVSGATAYTCPRRKVTYILVVHEALYFGTKLNHSLLNPNQIRMHGIPLWDNVFDPNHPEIGLDLGDLFIPFKTKGTKLLFSTRAPTEKELQECPHIHLTSRVPWEPSKVRLQEVNADVEHEDVEDPRSNEYELAALDPLSQIQAYDRRSLDVPTRATFASSERHPRVTPEELSERWGISVE